MLINLEWRMEVDYHIRRRRFDLEEQLLRPGEYDHSHYRLLDGWEINKNPLRHDKYLLEIARELGWATLPHWKR